MKTGWKVFWIVCAVIAAVGIVMTVAGIALGGLGMLSNTDESGPVHEWLQRTGRIVETEESVQNVQDELEEIPDIAADSGEYDSGYVPGEPDGDMITAYEGIDEISLDLSYLGVVVVPSGRDAVIVDTSQLAPEIRGDIAISQDGGKLELETDGHRGLKWDTAAAEMLYISIPEGTHYKSFSADVGAGMLEMEGVSADEISLDVGAGQIIADNFYTDVLEADCGAGQIIIQGEVLQKADLDCDIGEVLFTLPGEKTFYNYALSCSAGELIVGDEAYSGLHKQMKIDNGSSCTIDVDCRIGRMEVLYD